MARKGYEEHYNNKGAKIHQIGVTLAIILILLLPILFLYFMGAFLSAILHHKIGEDFSILLYIATLIFVLFRM